MRFESRKCVKISLTQNKSVPVELSTRYTTPESRLKR